MEPFELELIGAGVERRYRRMRPEIEEMPWGTLHTADFDPRLVEAARNAWTRAAFQEHRTGAACAETLRALIEARAPIDLIALATRFPLDELAHVELCSRMAMELGGGIELIHDPDHIVRRGDLNLSPLMRAADLVVRFFCVGEALSIPLLRAVARRAIHPLPRAVLSRIARDEAAHGAFGFIFLDWFLEDFDADDRRRLAEAADETVADIRRTWDEIRARPSGPPDQIHALGWMETDAYLELAEASLETRVLSPLRERGILVTA